MTVKKVGLFVMGLAGLLAGSHSVQASELESKVSKMISGDRTGLCLAVAVIDKDVQKALVCANPGDLKKRKLDFTTAFEIGSISKTMTAVILAHYIEQQQLSLDSKLADLFTSDINLPSFEGQDILLKHVVTHSSGLPALPPGFMPSNLADPYSDLSASKLLKSTASATLTRAPGAEFEYSNYAMLLLSLGLAEFSGKSFSELTQEHIFTPLGMQQAYTHKPGKKVRIAQGRSPLNEKVSAWSFGENLHGVGGVRASLNDMIKYAQANLNPPETALGTALTRTHVAVSAPSGQAMAMNWMINPVGSSQVIAHEGGTGGFSSFIAIDKQQQKAVVILSDTAVTSLGGLGEYAASLAGAAVQQVTPRVTQDAPTELLEQLSGTYRLPEFGLGMKVWHAQGKLKAQATGQQAFTLLYDSKGDFYPDFFDALLRPVKQSTGYTFQWFQGGAISQAERLEKKQNSYKVASSLLPEYVGTYPLVPGFSLNVARAGNGLTVQGTGQTALPVVAVAKDEFSQDDVGAHILFHRNDSGQVTALTLTQNGQELRGDKQ